jgi:hypothetical protein
VRVPLRRPGFSPDWDRVRSALTQRTRLLILNFPHNPSGAVLTADDLQVLAGLLRNSPAFVLADEVYEHMIYDGRRHHSLLTHAELAGRSLVVSSFGKTFHATGWKVGYCIATAELTAEFRKVHQFVQFAVATPLQAGIADFMAECPEHARDLPAFYQEKRDCFAELLGQTRFRFTPAASTYFQLVDYSAVSDLPDVEFARWLTTQCGVAAIPISVFSAQPPAAEIAPTGHRRRTHRPRLSAELGQRARQPLQAQRVVLVAAGELGVLDGARHEFEERLVERLAGRGELLRDRLAVVAFLDHALHRAQLAFHALEAQHEFAPCGGGRSRGFGRLRRRQLCSPARRPSSGSSPAGRRW